MTRFYAVREIQMPKAPLWAALSTRYGAMPWGVRPEHVEVERAGVDCPNGLGSIRVLRSWRGTIREETTEFEPEQRFGFRILAGVPASDFRGVIELHAKSSQVSRVAWTVDFRPRTFAAPVVAFIMKLALLDSVNGFVRDVTRGPEVEALG